MRAVDYNILPGVNSEKGPGDEWPEIRRRTLDANILIIGTPIWMGQPSSVCQRLIERLDAFLGGPTVQVDRKSKITRQKIMAEYPDDVRLALRYALFHKGSEEAARILEAARKQGLCEPVLEAVLAAQPQWHDDPQLQAAWEAAEAAGLDVEKAREVLNAPEITAALEQDAADIQAFEVKGTPTFLVNGEPLSRLNPQQLYDLVRSEVAKAR